MATGADAPDSAPAAVAAAGGGNAFVSAQSGLWGRWANRWAASRRFPAWRRAVLSRLPFVRLRSDVRDVVYQTWRVDALRAAAWVPPGVGLWQRGGQTLFTVLTYAHGHFGPALAGPLRRLLFPSPLQSNWRFYVERLPGGVAPAEPTVLFVKNVFDHPLYALGTRLFSDALPSHGAARFSHAVRRDDAGDPLHETRIEPGIGSAPAFHSRCRRVPERRLPAGWADCFDDWPQAVSFLCLQDAAVAAVEDVGGLALARIALPIDVTAVEPLALVSASSEFVARLGAVGEPLCFRVPSVRFEVLSERLL